MLNTGTNSNNAVFSRHHWGAPKSSKGLAVNHSCSHYFQCASLCVLKASPSFLGLSAWLRNCCSPPPHPPTEMKVRVFFFVFFRLPPSASHFAITQVAIAQISRHTGSLSAVGGNPPSVVPSSMFSRLSFRLWLKSYKIMTPPPPPPTHTSPSDHWLSVSFQDKQDIKRQTTAIVTIKRNITRFLFLFYVIAHLKYGVDLTKKYISLSISCLDWGFNLIRHIIESHLEI